MCVIQSMLGVPDSLSSASATLRTLQNNCVDENASDIIESLLVLDTNNQTKIFYKTHSKNAGRFQDVLSNNHNRDHTLTEY